MTLADQLRQTNTNTFEGRRADLIAQADQLATERDKWKREALDLRNNPRDEHHTMDELYYYRMLYHAHAANLWAKHGPHVVVKSWRHHTGELCFGGGWFIVTADIGSGQVTNHYRDTYWDLFDVPELQTAPEWDGHTPGVGAERLHTALKGNA